MATTYKLIDKSILGSSVTSVSFTSIPSTYTDLKIVISGRSDRSGTYEDSINLRVGNGTVSSTGYSYIIIYEYAGSVSVSQASGQNEVLWQSPVTSTLATANTVGNSQLYIPNYTSSNAKSFSGDSATENNGTDQLLGFTAGLWSGTSAINIITMTPRNGTNFISGSSFYLYGIKNS